MKVIRGDLPRRSWTLVLPMKRPVMTSNDQRRWHWTKVREAKAGMQSAVWAAAKKARIPTLTEETTVTVTWYPPDRRRRDPDALSPFLKAAMDGLVQARVLHDDSHPWVSGCAMEIAAPDGDPRIEIEIREES